MTWQLIKAETLAAQQAPEAKQVENCSIDIAQFITNAPTDFLEPLLSSPFGRVYTLFLERCCTREFTSSEARQQKNELSQQLRQKGCETQEGWAVLLALMPFFPPAQLKVEDPSSKLPAWLLKLYSERYESSASSSDPINTTTVKQAPTPQGQPSFDDRIFLNRVLGLSNLYYIDPEDQEILQELRDVRMQTINLILATSKEELGRQFQADFGDRFWAMAQSGVQKEPLNAQEAEQKNSLQNWLTSTPQSLHAEGGIQRFVSTILFASPGSVKLANPEQNLPAWFIEGFKRYCSMSAA
ncbi:hypothetical protein PMIT1342_01831 [Prochlorococcus marinus str. MIT 1342]|uniref:hypothetical protein n=1 Tax=Prochlorococcus TaxID=1218 RepID=UPI0007B36B80|nr:hypothetical protein [Prochlorococcus marinus]KZR79886.1 hypothetical protein PMIT1342_01831 [Prochlorococcus marinus str. MIT 1342]